MQQRTDSDPNSVSNSGLVKHTGHGSSFSAFGFGFFFVVMETVVRDS
jgi:hypothetical protein